MPIPEEYSQRRNPDELVCLTPEAIQEFRPRPLHELAAEVGAERAAAARQRLAGLTPDERRRQLRSSWAKLLGDIEPKADPKVLEHRKQPAAAATFEHIALEVEPGVVVPLVMLVPPPGRARVPPVVLGLAQGGKQAFLEQRADPIAELLDGGAAVCRRREGNRGNETWERLATSLGRADDDLGIGVAARPDARRLPAARPPLGAALLALPRRSRHGPRCVWGDSFSAPNPKDRNLAVPLETDPFPDLAQPLGGLLALFGALFEDDVRCVYVRGGLTGFDSLLHSPFCYVPARRLDSRQPSRRVTSATLRRHWGLGRCEWRASLMASTARSRAGRDGRHGTGPIGIPSAGRRD